MINYITEKYAEQNISFKTALTDKINQLNKSMTRLYEIDDKLKDPNISVVDKTKLQEKRKF